MNNQKGILIVIDWTDGSGKATQTEFLYQKLLSEGYMVEKINFPQYWKKSAGMAEEYLNGKYGTAHQITPYQASIFYAVDRFDASFTIRRWLDEGKIVISDRYVSANMWHQAGKIEDPQEKEKFLDWLEHLEYWIFNIPKPDINIFLYMNPEISRNLALNVVKKNMDKTKDIHENDPEHMNKASENFRNLAKKYSWIQVDCFYNNAIRTREDIAQEIYTKIATKLPKY